MKTRTGAEGGEFTSVSPSLRTKFPQKPVCRPEKDGSYIRHVSLKSLSPTYDGYTMALLQRSVLKIFILPFKLS